jgi:hypothetical protein
MPSRWDPDAEKLVAESDAPMPCSPTSITDTDGVEAAFREGFALGDFAGGGQADPRTVDRAWQNSRARAALRPTDGAAR